MLNWCAFAVRYIVVINAWHAGVCKVSHRQERPCNPSSLERNASESARKKSIPDKFLYGLSVRRSCELYISREFIHRRVAQAR